MKRGLNYFLLLLLSVFILALIFNTSNKIQFSPQESLILRPIANGGYSEWNKFGCDSNFKCVDEIKEDINDKLKISNPKKSSFYFESFTLKNVKINSLSIYYYAKYNTGSSDSCFSVFMKKEKMNFTSVKQICTTKYWILYSESFEKNPFTKNNWTINDLNNLEIGMESTKPNAGGQIAQIYIKVNYENLSCDKGGCLLPKCEGNICESYQVCDGEIFFDRETNRCCNGTCRLPKNFDWRNRHGENWNSPVKNQGSISSCPGFGALASIESAINLYFNKHLDLDLSEQSTFSCSNELYHEFSFDINLHKCFGINSPASIICNAKFTGIVDEKCYPYVDHFTPDTFVCNNLCLLYTITFKQRLSILDIR